MGIKVTAYIPHSLMYQASVKIKSGGGVLLWDCDEGMCQRSRTSAACLAAVQHLLAALYLGRLREDRLSVSACYRCPSPSFCALLKGTGALVVGLSYV